MNPFLLNKSPTGISITCTNFRGLGVTVADKKINWILTLKADVHILIDSRCSEDKFNHFLNTSKYKYMMSNYKHVGSYNKSKGVIVLYIKNKTKVDDVAIIQDGMLLRLKINIEYIRILGSYAPLASDEPEFFYKCKDVLNLSTEKHGLIVGDLNTTLHPELDRKNYKTDSHKKSRLSLTIGSQMKK